MSYTAASYQETYQEPYTKYPNRYNDVIKPGLTDAQRDVCDVVIRMTYGWHQTRAAIPNSIFVKKTGKSKQGIIKAKKQLEEKGVLIVLEQGGGSRANEYMLDLWYDNPDKSVKASMVREEQLLEMENPSPPDKQEDIPELVEVQEPQRVESESRILEEPDSDQELSDAIEVENPSSIEDSEPDTSKLSLLPYKEDGNIISSIEKKQTVVDPENEKPKERKKAAATVRYKFFSLFPEAQADDDWAFFGWTAREYGLAVCLEKLDYMREHRKKYTIANPKGFFRMALVKDYQVPESIRAKLRADERAKREAVRFRQEREQWNKTVENFNYDSALASLQKLLDSLG